jgi:hypothetical protein
MRKAYVVCQSYERESKGRGIWDESDRILNLLIRSQLEPIGGYCNVLEGTDYDKVYMDKIQHFT